MSLSMREIKQPKISKDIKDLEIITKVDFVDIH